jgi:LysM repeat protein
LSWRLKSSVRVLLRAALVVALAAAVLALYPTVAEAQGTSSQGTSSVVVRPGDSLWSISREQLGQSATPQQIANGVEQIYALNQNRLGSDPNLIFAGQKLLLPPAGEPSSAEPSTGATPAPEATEPAKASTRDPARAKASAKASKTPLNTEAEPVALRDMPANQATPKVRSPAETDASSPAESFGKIARSLLSSATSAVVGLFPQDDLLGRKLLGLGIIVLTLFVGGLMAWKLPIKRSVGSWEVWGIPSGYPGRYAYSQTLDRRGRRGSTPAAASALTGSGSNYHISKSKNTATKQAVSSVGLARVARVRQRLMLPGQPLGSGRFLRKGLATGGYGPEVRRPLLRIAARTRPWLSENVRTQASQRRGGNP